MAKTRGRPPDPARAGADAPVLFLRLNAETEAALMIVKFEHGSADLRAATRTALRNEALRLGGPGRLEHATAMVTKKRAARQG